MEFGCDDDNYKCVDGDTHYDHGNGDDGGGMVMMVMVMMGVVMVMMAVVMVMMVMVMMVMVMMVYNMVTNTTMMVMQALVWNEQKAEGTNRKSDDGISVDDESGTCTLYYTIL